MCNREDRYSWFAVRTVQYLLHVEWLTFHPTAKAGSGEQIVKRHRQLKSIFRWKERFKIHDAHFGHWRQFEFAE